MCNALGIITYNDSSVYVEGMQKYRPIAAFSFLGRYRLVDFAISNMSNSGIESGYYVEDIVDQSRWCPRRCPVFYRAIWR